MRAYLDIEALIAAAKATGCDCVHPGYGFLSENAAFAERCAAEGLTFIGPRPRDAGALRRQDRGARARPSLGIPIVPGSAARSASSDEAQGARRGHWLSGDAESGGRRRRARHARRGAAPRRWPRPSRAARGEAQAAFGDGALFLEKLVPRPRHIEVQVLADSHGNIVHLYERDCSVQLRNQKVVEIAPAPGLDQGLRQRILADAIRLARAARYVNAGTVEFLVSPRRGEHFFIECNPRIQVEHTVTEQVTGVDLVEAQFRIAAGETLAALGLADQEAVAAPRGFAVQARIVARAPARSPPTRSRPVPACASIPAAISGYAPPPQFDPMFAKLICRSNSSGIVRLGARPHAARARRVPHRRPADQSRQLRAILSHPDVPRRRCAHHAAREHPSAERPKAAAAAALLEQQVASPRAAARGLPSAAPRTGRLPVPAGDEAVESPMAGSSSSVKVARAPRSKAGDTLMVISAMKMETASPRPAPASSPTLAPLEVGATVAPARSSQPSRPRPARAKAAPRA